MVSVKKLVNRSEPVNGKEINDELSTVPSYIGIFKLEDIDKLRIIKFPISFVVYYREHWTAFYVLSTKLDIMDSTHSLMENPTTEFINFLYQNRNKTITINPIVQGSQTNTCGLYVLDFIQSRENGDSYSQVLQKFTDNNMINDYIINQIISI